MSGTQYSKDASEAFISVSDFANQMGYNPESVRRMCRERRLPAIHIGKRWYISRTHLQAYVDEQLAGAER